MFTDKEKAKVRVDIAYELNKHLKDRWDKLSDDAKRCLGLSDGERRDILFMMWSSQFYIERIVKLEEDIADWKRELADVIHHTNYC